jgi:hypothetical protein
MQVPVRKRSVEKRRCGYYILTALFIIAADENKAMYRPCHSNVEDSHFLSERFTASVILDYLVCKRVEAGICVGIYNTQAKSRLLIDEAIPLGVLFAEGAVEVCNKNDGEFEAFAFVDAEYPDGVSRGGLGFCGRPVLAGGKKFFDKFDESGKRGNAGIACEGLELNSPVVKLEEIGPARGAVGQCADKREQA